MSKVRKTDRSKKDPGKAFFQDSEMVDVVGMFGALRRRKWSIAIITVLGTAAAYFYGDSIVPTYNAKTTLLVEPTNTGIEELEATTASGVTTDFNAIATQIRLLQSRSYQARVMEDLGLFDDPDFNYALAEPEPGLLDRIPLQVLAEPLDALADWLPGDWFVARGAAQEEPEVLESSAPLIARERAIDVFSGRLELLADPAAYVINIGFNSTDPEKAARIANRVAEMYVDDQLNNKIFATDRTSSWLEERLPRPAGGLRGAPGRGAGLPSPKLRGGGRGGGRGPPRR